MYRCVCVCARPAQNGCQMSPFPSHLTWSSVLASLMAIHLILYYSGANVNGGLFCFPGLQLSKGFQQMTLGKNNHRVLYPHDLLFLPIPVGHGPTTLAPKCSNPACSRTCFPAEEGTYYDFCGITCRNKYRQNTISLATGEWKQHSTKDSNFCVHENILLGKIFAVEWQRWLGIENCL